MIRFDKKQAEAYMEKFPMPDIFSFDIEPYIHVVNR